MFVIYLPPPPSPKSNLLICYGPQSGIDEDSSKIYFYRIWIIDFHDFVIIPNAEPWTAVNKKKFSSICGIREITLKRFCLKRFKNVIKTRPTLPDCVTNNYKSKICTYECRYVNVCKNV